MPIFQSIPALNGLSKSIALVQKCENAVFQKFVLISKWNRIQIQLIYWLMINSSSPMSGWQRYQGMYGAEPTAV